MRLAIITTQGTHDGGGSEDLWIDLAVKALQAGHEVAVSASLPSAQNPLRRLGELQAGGAKFYYRRVPFGGRLQRLHKLNRGYSFLTRQYGKLLAFKPDAVFFSLAHTPACTPLFDENRLMNRLAGLRIPYVAVSQMHDEGGASIFERDRQRTLDFMRGAHRACFVSQRNLDTVRRQVADALPNAMVVRNPVNLTDRSIVAWPASQTALFAGVGRLLTGSKGQEILLECLSRPQWMARPWKLRLYGDGIHREYLVRLAEFLGIGDRVEFKGYVRDIRQAWAENQVLVMPSRVEGTPLAMVEAMLCGRPAVVTDVGGNAEWVEEGKSGFIADTASVRSYGAALERAWGARHRWEEMGRAAHETASRLVDPSPGGTLLRILGEAVAGSAAP